MLIVSRTWGRSGCILGVVVDGAYYILTPDICVGGMEYFGVWVKQDRYPHWPLFQRSWG